MWAADRLWPAAGLALPVGYDPRAFVPTAADRRQGDLLIARLRAASGPVFVPFHPFYARRAGKTPSLHAMNLADGIIRARYRNGFERAKLLEPDKVYAITFTLFPTSNLFKAGHRIRVDLSSSNYPTYDPNPNTGDAYLVGGRSQVAENCIYHDADRPSLTIAIRNPGTTADLTAASIFVILLGGGWKLSRSAGL